MVRPDKNLLCYELNKMFQKFYNIKYFIVVFLSFFEIINHIYIIKILIYILYDLNYSNFMIGFDFKFLI